MIRILYKRMSFLMVFMGAVFFSQAQDLVIPADGTHFVTSDETFDNVTVNGFLSIALGKKFTVNNKVIVNAGGRVSLLKNADLNVSNALEVYGFLMAIDGADITAGTLYMHSGKIAISSRTNVEVGASQLNDGSEISLNGDCIFRFNGEVITLGPFICSMSSTDEFAFNGNVSFEEVDKIDFRNGIVGFSGGKDQILNASKFEADNVKIYAQTLKLVTSDSVRINKSLTLYSSKLVSDKPVKISSTDPGAIKRGSGYIIAPSLTRQVDRKEIYTFPIGSLNRISAAQIYPLANTAGKITVALTEGSANNLSEIPTEVFGVNKIFFHSIYKQGGVNEVDIALFYNLPVPFNKVITYNETSLKWGLLSSFSESLSMAPGMIGVSGRKVKLSTYNTLNPGATLFVLAKTDVQQTVNSKSYAVLNKKLDGGYVWIADGILRFQFEEEYPKDNDVLKWVVYDADHKAKSSPETFSATYGDNRYEINILSLVSSGFGVLEVSNNKNEKWYLKFKAGGF